MFPHCYFEKSLSPNWNDEFKLCSMFYHSRHLFFLRLISTQDCNSIEKKFFLLINLAILLTLKIVMCNLTKEIINKGDFHEA